METINGDMVVDTSSVEDAKANVQFHMTKDEMQEGLHLMKQVEKILGIRQARILAIIARRLLPLCSVEQIVDILEITAADIAKVQAETEAADVITEVIV
jgi:predicted transposase YdaD